GRLRPVPAPPVAPPAALPDLADVRGQELGKRLLEVAAAGRHNALLTGPPGAGKTMLATRLPSLLPPLGTRGAVEVGRVYSAAGLSRGHGLDRSPPFRAPHHSGSSAGIVGGGSSVRPGEASLAHLGVLFLDEAPEFARPVLEALRQPLESGVIVISRASGAVALPARFHLVAARNPCPCGRALDDDPPPRPCPRSGLLRYAALPRGAPRRPAGGAQRGRRPPGGGGARGRAGAAGLPQRRPRRPRAQAPRPAVGPWGVTPPRPRRQAPPHRPRLRPAAARGAHGRRPRGRVRGAGRAPGGGRRVPGLRRAFAAARAADRDKRPYLRTARRDRD